MLIFASAWYGMAVFTPGKDKCFTLFVRPRDPAREQWTGRRAGTEGAVSRYGADQVRLQQVVWPDPHGRFPWDPGYQYPPQAQPLLGRP